MENLRVNKSLEHIHALKEKLKNAINEYAKLEVKLNEDTKLTEILETLPYLAGQVRDAEQDKKISASLNAFESLQLKLSGPSTNPEAGEEMIITSEEQLMEPRTGKEEKEKAYLEEYSRITSRMEEKDYLIQDLEGATAEKKLCLESLTSHLEEVQHDLYLKEVIQENLESEIPVVISKKAAAESVVAKLEKNIEQLSETSSLSETKVPDLLLKISALESENQDVQDQLKVNLLGALDDIEALQEEIMSQEQLVDSLGKQVNQLQENLKEKEQLHLQYEEREKLLEGKNLEAQASLAASENTLTDAKKQYDLMLGSKQMELTKCEENLVESEVESQIYLIIVQTEV